MALANRTKYSLIVFVVTLGIYGLTLAPSISSTDSAYWVVNSLLGGVPKAPGNLLYLLLAALSARIFFFLEPAAAVNLLSALCAAFSASLIFTLLERAVARTRTKKLLGTGSESWITAAGAVFLAALPSVWSVAVQAGPEALNVLLMVFQLWLLVRIHEGSGRKAFWALLWAYLMGLAFSHDHVFVLGALSLVFFALASAELRHTLRERLRGLLVAFALGLTLYLYLSIRSMSAGVDLLPDTFGGGLGAYIFRSEAFWNMLPRKAGFILYQVPLALGYLKSQAGHWIAGAALLLILLYALLIHWKTDRKTLISGLLLMFFAGLAALWFLNPRLGPNQALEKFSNPLAHEQAELDRQFLFLYLIAGSWVILGIVFIKRDLMAFVDWVLKRWGLEDSRLGARLAALLAVIMSAVLLAFVGLRWSSSDMSGNLATRDLAENMLAGTENNAILMVANDDEYYPLVYINNILNKQKDRNILSLLRMTDKAYLKGFKSFSPPVPLIYDNKQIDQLRPVRLGQTEPFQVGGLELSYPENTELGVRDLVLLDIVRANQTKRPLRFSYSLTPGYLAGLEKYMALQALCSVLLDHDPSASKDSLNYWRKRDDELWIDLNRSQQLLWEVYTYHPNWSNPWRIFFKLRERFKKQMGESGPEQYMGMQRKGNKGFSPVVYAFLHDRLGDAFLERGIMPAATRNFLQCEFFNPEYSETMYNIAARFAKAHYYEGAKAVMKGYFEKFPQDPLKWTTLAKMALENTDSVPATEMLLEAIRQDPNFTIAYRKLIRLYDSMGQKLMAAAFLSQWAGQHPEDAQAKKLWEDYNTTETLPPDFQD